MSDFKLPSSPLPDSGLIVSCYLSDWKSREKEFIKIVSGNPNVVALRVEGEDNIKFAKDYSGKCVVGLIKDFAYPNYITPTDNHAKRCFLAGADFVAVDMRLSKEIHKDNLLNWKDYHSVLVFNDNKFIVYTDYFKRCWADLKYEQYDYTQTEFNFPIVSTTFAEGLHWKVLDKVDKEFALKHLNIEGGVNLKNYKELKKRAKYVTIGKAIHDPNTIINLLTKEGLV
jgi:hypothetical protein